MLQWHHTCLHFKYTMGTRQLSPKWCHLENVMRWTYTAITFIHGQSKIWEFSRGPRRPGHYTLLLLTCVLYWSRYYTITVLHNTVCLPYLSHPDCILSGSPRNVIHLQIIYHVFKHRDMFFFRQNWDIILQIISDRETKTIGEALICNHMKCNEGLLNEVQYYLNSLFNPHTL